MLKEWERKKKQYGVVNKASKQGQVSKLRRK
jgi:hypothetical protein